MNKDLVFPRVEIEGPPRERGMQYGRAVPERIAASVALYQGEMLRRGVPVPRQRELAARFVPVIASFGADYLDEMQGIADGAGVPLEDVVLINARTEMMYGSHDAPEVQSKLVEGCTGAIILPEATRDGRLVHAHNWDWRAECADTSIVLCIRRDNAPDLLTFVEAGGLARHGFNSNGLALTGNFLQSDRDFKAPGAPLGLVRRKMLEAPTMAAALKVLWAQPRACSNNLMLSHADGEAVDLECAPDEIFWISPEQGMLVHANHFVSPSARVKLRDTGLATFPDSLYRDRRVRSLLAPHVGRITREHVTAALFDTFGAPDAVLRSPKPAVFDAISATVATIIMEPAAGTMQVARKPYEDPRFSEYRL
jgi:isopenicillin-N N-acyltransferase-like protein